MVIQIYHEVMKSIEDQNYDSKSSNYSNNLSFRSEVYIFGILFTSLALSIFFSSQKIGWPVWAFLTGNNDAFSDFAGDRFELPNTYFHMTGPDGKPSPVYGVLAPGGVLIGKLYSLFLIPQTLWVFQIVALTSCILTVITISGRRNYHFSILILFSAYPFWFAYFRGNNDIWLFPLLGLAYLQFSKKNYNLFTLFIVSAAAIEPYNILFLVALIPLKKYKYILYSSIYLFIYLLSMAFVGEKNLGRYISLFEYTGKWYNESYVINNSGLLANNSIWGLLKVVTFMFRPTNLTPESFIYHFYTIGTLLSVCVMTIYLARKKLQIEYFFAITSLEILFFAPTSANYKLITFLLSFFIIIYKMNIDLFANKIFLALSLALLLPKEFIWFKFTNEPLGATLGTVVNPILEIIMIFAILKINSRKVN